MSTPASTSGSSNLLGLINTDIAEINKKMTALSGLPDMVSSANSKIQNVKDENRDFLKVLFGEMTDTITKSVDRQTSDLKTSLNESHEKFAKTVEDSLTKQTEALNKANAENYNKVIAKLESMEKTLSGKKEDESFFTPLKEPSTWGTAVLVGAVGFGGAMAGGYLASSRAANQAHMGGEETRAGGRGR